MRAFGNLEAPVEQVLGVYFHFCALAMSCRQLALAGRHLMADGRTRSPDGSAGHIVISMQCTWRINAMMLMCGHYDSSGDFAQRVGLASKSGVGGGILAIAPGIASIAVWSPGLNVSSNSHLGTLALDQLTRTTGWSVLDSGV